jgi:cytochrome P450
MSNDIPTCPVALPVDFRVDADESFGSAHRQYAELRARCPVAHTDSLGGFWAVTRYADVLQVLGEPETYITSVQNVVPKVAFTGRRPPLHLDPPEHTPYRAVLNPLLSPERVALLEPTVRRLTREHLKQLLDAGSGDICEVVGGQVPVKVFATWMQLPAPLEAALMDAGPAFVRAVEANDPEAMKATSLALYDMARELIALRHREPLDPDSDPTSAILAARINGEPVPDAMAIGMVRQVLVVGIVAPLVMTGNVAVHLAQHPALHAQLKADPALVPAALEEFLRLYTPYRGFARTANRDVELGGRQIGAGEAIALVYASANRDEAVFERPDEFILDRPNIKDHIAFGRGAHYCAGAALGRLQVRVLLEELLAATTRLELLAEPVMSPFPELGPWQVRVRLLAG